MLHTVVFTEGETMDKTKDNGGMSKPDNMPMHPPGPQKGMSEKEYSDSCARGHTGQGKKK